MSSLATPRDAIFLARANKGTIATHSVVTIFCGTPGCFSVRTNCVTPQLLHRLPLTYHIPLQLLYRSPTHLTPATLHVRPLHLIPATLTLPPHISHFLAPRHTPPTLRLLFRSPNQIPRYTFSYLTAPQPATLPFTRLIPIQLLNARPPHPHFHRPPAHYRHFSCFTDPDVRSNSSIFPIPTAARPKQKKAAEASPATLYQSLRRIFRAFVSFRPRRCLLRGHDRRRRLILHVLILIASPHPVVIRNRRTNVLFAVFVIQPLPHPFFRKVCGNAPVFMHKRR